MKALYAVVALVLLVGCAAVAADKPARTPEDSTREEASGGGSAAAPAADGSLSAESSVDQILDALDARGRKLEAFTADVSLTEGDETLANEVTRHGKVLYQDRKAQGGPRLRVIFTQRDTGTRQFDDKVEYLLDDGWLTDRTYNKKPKIQVRRQVLRPGEKIDLLKLGEGPFPLPIGQKKEAVYKQFEVKKVAPKKNDPPGTIHVQLKPKAGTQFERKFDSIEVWVDAKTHMPARIETLSGETFRTTDLKNFTVNPKPPLTDADFKLPEINEKEWDLHEEAFRE